MPWKRLVATLFGTNPRRRRSGSTFQPSLETLEDRLVPSTMTYRVTNTADFGAGSLREAIFRANENEGKDTIVFARNVRGEIELSSELIIKDDLVIRGSGANKITISGEGSTRVFRVDSNPGQSFSVPVDENGVPNLIDVEIHNLTIANGLATDAPGFPPDLTDPDGNPLFPGFGFGGGIYNRGNSVTLVGVHMTGNQAGDGATIILAAGGAIANEFGGTLTIHHSTFANNTSRGIFLSVGGAITQDIGPTPDGEGTKAPTAFVTQSSFYGNRSEALVSHPDMSGGLAPFAGWAIGGAFANIAGSLTGHHNTFVGNEARAGLGVAMAGGQYSVGNGGTAIGGAIFSDDFSPFDTAGLPGRDAVIDLRHNVFSGNATFGGAGSGAGAGGAGAGGAIGIGLSYDESTDELLGTSFGFTGDSGTVRQNLFSSNTANGGAGGAGGGDGGNGIGGGIAILSAATLEVEQSYFINNSAHGGEGMGSGSGGTGLGGAIGLDLLPLSAPIPDFPPPEAFLPAVDVHRSVFAYNDATGGSGGNDGGAGGNGLGGAIGVTSGATADLVWSALLANQAVGGQGGSQGGDGGNGQGGGVFNGADSATTLTHSVVVGNWAIAGSGESGGTDGLGQGGGLFSSAMGDLTVDLFSLLATRLNHATDDGPNIYW